MGQYSQRFCLSQNSTTATAEAAATVIDSNHQNIERKGAKDRVMTKYTFRVSHSICPSWAGPGGHLFVIFNDLLMGLDSVVLYIYATDHKMNQLNRTFVDVFNQVY